MTLVAGFSLGGMPAFIGDLLLSRRLPAPADLPTRSEEAVQPGEDGFFAASLAQKLVLVRPYFLVAWAGSRSNAERILRELDRLLPVTFEAIDDPSPIWEVLNSCAEDSEMVVLIIGDGLIQPLGIRTRGFEIDGKRVYLLGSGKSAFFDYLTAHADVMPEGDSKGLLACAAALRFGARAIQTQWITGGGLEESWGGGFEVVYPEFGAFRKVDRVLQRAWRIDSAGDYSNSGRSFFVRYHGGDLYLSAFNPGERTYVVASPIGAGDKPPSFEIAHPAWTVDMFVHEPTASLVEFVRFHPDARPTEDFVELSDGELTGWSMDQGYVERCVQTALEHVGKGNTFRMHRY